MEAASIDWEQELFAAQRPYVERQLGAGVARNTVVRDLVGMGADANRAGFFVDTAAKKLASVAPAAAKVVGPRSLHAYVLWAAFAGVFGAVLGGLLVVGLGLEVTPESVQIGNPTLMTVGRIEAASLLPAVIVSSLLRRHLCSSLYWRPVIAALVAFAAILGVRLLTTVEILHELPGGQARGQLLGSERVLSAFAMAPTNVYDAFSGPAVGTLVLWDVGFVGLAAFIAAVFSRHPAEA